MELSKPASTNRESVNFSWSKVLRISLYIFDLDKVGSSTTTNNNRSNEIIIDYGINLGSPS